MKLGRIGAALAALSLTASPVVAQAASLDLSRAFAPASQSSQVDDENLPLYILAGVVAVILVVVLISDGDSDSP